MNWTDAILLLSEFARNCAITVASCVGALVALRGLSAWKKERSWDRKKDTGELAIACCDKAIELSLQLNLLTRRKFMDYDEQGNALDSFRNDVESIFGELQNNHSRWNDVWPLLQLFYSVSILEKFTEFLDTSNAELGDLSAALEGNKMPVIGDLSSLQLDTSKLRNVRDDLRTKIYRELYLSQ